ncbi:Histidine kinase-, DNA gyrase B-, and HSP90-like ATPase [Micromonospora nigra]|uniref:histidine kinase n=1 Tax=Micromonospora nigra TaxID=145857 RepID=A0A1C6SSG2_9ACTN|nr:HAMP domain-containing sensor histidine kinase [Micromonospora nigra]SCL32418.1 Histidine kinase-, DNA gyrase B-, and HSP90-like ATPase [Micromonospora nigra]
MGGRHAIGSLLGALRRTGPAPVPVPGGPVLHAASADLLLRVLCHELRTPVSTLTSLTRALADEARPLAGDDRRAISALAREQAEHLHGLLAEVAVSTGVLALATCWEDRLVPLAEILPAVATLVPPERRRIEVTRNAGHCRVPQRRTRQVLTNLVENALRHGPAAGAVGIVATRRRCGLSITVTDEGHVDDTLLEALGRSVPSAGLSGLGLWIVRQLLAADGGAVRLHRLRPGGVAVEVVLPHALPAG